jgi:hypothetical protein
VTVELANMKGVSVVQDHDGRIHWTSGAAIDADGSNGQNGNRFAYRADDTGLDALANAGWPDQDWRNVPVDDGHGRPTSDGNGNWYSQTTYAWKHRPIITRYVDSTAVPYVVVNPIVRRKAVGIVIGCLARVTYNGQSIDAVVTVVSGPHNIGELSIRVAEPLQIPSSPRARHLGTCQHPCTRKAGKLAFTEQGTPKTSGCLRIDKSAWVLG